MFDPRHSKQSERDRSQATPEEKTRKKRSAGDPTDIPAYTQLAWGNQPSPGLRLPDESKQDESKQKASKTEEAPTNTDYTADSLLKILVEETRGGKEIYEEALRAMGGKLEIVLGKESEMDLQAGILSIDSNQSLRMALRSLVFELGNAIVRDEFGDLDKAAAAGRVSRIVYMMEMERIEFENAGLRSFIMLYNNMKNTSWGKPDETSIRFLAGSRGLNFKQFSTKFANSKSFIAHVTHYGEVWEAHYKDAYELYISTGGTELYKAKEPLVTYPAAPFPESIERQISKE